MTRVALSALFVMTFAAAFPRWDQFATGRKAASG